MLAQKIQRILLARGKSLDLTRDAKVVEDEGGERIGRWDEEKLGPRPTQEEIDAVDLNSLLRAAAWDRIKAERDRRTQQGGYLAAGKWFHSDTFSRSQQLGLVLLGNAIPPGTQWKTMDGSFVTMTPTLAQQIFAAAAASDIAIFAAAEAHKAALEASADPAAYDWSGGWPAQFDAP